MRAQALAILGPLSLMLFILPQSRAEILATDKTPYSSTNTRYHKRDQSGQQDQKLPSIVRAPINEKMFKTKISNPAQIYLGNMADIRDLDVLIANTQGKYLSSLAATHSYEILFENQQRLMERRAISHNEFVKARFDVEFSRANAKVYNALIEGYQARKEQKIYQAKVAARKAKFEVDTLYAYYNKEWDAHCNSVSAFLETSEAQLRLNQALYDSLLTPYQSNAASTNEMQVRIRDLAAAVSDHQAKKESLAKCRDGLPTLSELREMQNE